MKILVVINPRSGGGRGKEMGGKVRSYLQISSHQNKFIEETSLGATLKNLDSALTVERFEILICVGGDGFIHDILPICVAYGLKLLVIPAGTGNDFCRTMGSNEVDFKKLLESPDRSSARAIDLGSIAHAGGETSFVQILSTGFDAVVNERANNFKLIRGKLKYVVAVLLEIWRFKALDFKVVVDQEEISCKAMLVCIANGNSYGGGMKVVPHARNDDGILDVMILEKLNRLSLLLVFPKVFSGKHVSHPKLRFYSGRRIQIAGDTWAYADGERISALPIEVSLSPNKLLVYTV